MRERRGLHRFFGQSSGEPFAEIALFGFEGRGVNDELLNPSEFRFCIAESSLRSLIESLERVADQLHDLPALEVAHQYTPSGQGAVGETDFSSGDES